MEETTNSTNVDSKELKYSTELLQTNGLTYFKEDEQVKKEHNIDVAVINIEFTPADIVNKTMEAQYGVSTISALPINSNDKEKIKSEKKAILDKQIKAMIASGKIVDVAWAICSSYTVEQLEEANKRIKGKKEQQLDDSKIIDSIES